MKRIVISSFIVTLFHLASGQSLITVKQDGTGDYTTIQQAVDTAGIGDTVLVWPGTYIENVSIENKSIVLGSLTLSTGNPSYIMQTIIDGNQTGSCIYLRDCPNGIEIVGFGITNGSGSDWGYLCGGGLYIHNATCSITSCIIYKNIVSGYGGGMIIHYDSDVFLSNTTIRNNQSYDYGGGITILNSTLTFDTINKCNIYCNYAAVGMDVFKFNNEDTLHVVADTFTVQNPDYYYLFCNHYGNVGTGITHDVNMGKIEQTYQDLYVSPDGDNANTGLSPDQPLKNISFALLKMASDSITPDTIHLTNGVYSIANGEKFPLSIKAHGNIKGNHRDSCILDAEYQNYIMFGIYQANYYEISNLTLQHTDHNIHNNNTENIGAASLVRNNNSGFRNVLVQNNKGTICSGIQPSVSNNFLFHGVEFMDNIGGHALRAGSNEVDTVFLYNCLFLGNMPDYDYSNAIGGACIFIGSYQFADLTAFLYNCLFTQNHARGTSSSLYMLESTQVYLVNCTFTSNTSDIQNRGGIALSRGNNHLHIYNSILFEQGSPEVMLGYLDEPNHLNIYHSLIDEGEDGIIEFTPGNYIYYDPSNIDDNPMFDTASMFPYSLSSGSPCINAGTLDLPPGIELPETDLAGNPRVYDGYIDMGAYEYGPWVGIDKYNSKPKTQNSKFLEAFPNPFRFETNISYIKPESGKCTIRVYDMNGRMVKTLMDGQGLAGEGTIKWNGTNDSGIKISPGTYIIAITINGKERDAVKIIKRG